MHSPFRLHPARWLVIGLLCAATLACGVTQAAPTAQIVEVTRLVRATQLVQAPPVEATRLVEVTRLIEVPPTQVPPTQPPPTEAAAPTAYPPPEGAAPTQAPPPAGAAPPPAGAAPTQAPAAAPGATLSVLLPEREVTRLVLVAPREVTRIVPVTRMATVLATVIVVVEVPAAAPPSPPPAVPVPAPTFAPAPTAAPIFAPTPTPYAPPVNASLLVHYDFEGDFLASGIVRDRSGNGQDARLLGDAEIAQGIDGGQAIRLNGNGYLQAEGNPAAGRSSVSFCLWFKTDQPQENYKLASAAWWNYGPGSGWILGTHIPEFWSDDTQGLYLPNQANNDNAFSAGAWNFEVVTYDGQSIREYTNGVLINDWAATGAALGQGKPMVIGGWLPYTAYNFQGDLDEFQIFSWALTPEEVRSLDR